MNINKITIRAFVIVFIVVIILVFFHSNQIFNEFNLKLLFWFNMLISCKINPPTCMLIFVCDVKIIDKNHSHKIVYPPVGVELAEWIEPLFNNTTTFKTKSFGTMWQCGKTSSRSNSITWQSTASSAAASSGLRSAFGVLQWSYQYL